MNMKPVLLIAAAALMLGVADCDTSKYGQVEQGKVIAFNEDAQLVTVVYDTNIDPSNPKYDKMPPVVFKLPANRKEIGPLPKVGQRLQLNLEEKKLEIYDAQKQTLVYIDIPDADVQKDIGKEHALVKDQSFPKIDSEKGTITVYSGRLKALCTFGIPAGYENYPPETWTTGDEVRIYFKPESGQAGTRESPFQARRFMNITQTNIYKK